MEKQLVHIFITLEISVPNILIEMLHLFHPRYHEDDHILSLIVAALLHFKPECSNRLGNPKRRFIITN